MGALRGCLCRLGHGDARAENALCTSMVLPCAKGGTERASRPLFRLVDAQSPRQLGLVSPNLLERRRK